MIRVLIADDEQLVRAGLRKIMETTDDIVVVGEARDGAEAVSAAARLQPDVVLLDVRMPGTDGVVAAGRIAGPKVLMLTTFDTDENVYGALRAGAVGFLLKDTPPLDLIEAVRTLAAGNAVLAPSVTTRLIGTIAAQPRPSSQRLDALSYRERQVLRGVARGLSNAEIGRELGMTEGTVKAHVSRAMARLGVSNRVRAAILAREAGLHLADD